MTFVPLSHEQLADDLLTSLTGGVAHEEHRYVGPKLPYPLEAPDALPESLSVSGVSRGASVAFRGGVDFALSTKGEIVWRKSADARLPDDDSYFYASYYRDEAPRRLTDRNPGSVTWTLAQAFGRELAVVQQQMKFIYESGFVDTATGPALDQVAALLAVTRRDARFAVGEVTFRRSTPAPGDIAIPAGMLVSTVAGQNFETSEERVLRRGQLAVSVPIRAQVEGPTGLVDRGTIVVVNRPVFGIEAVTNEEKSSFAAERESDEALRRRIRGTIERAGRSTVSAIRQALIEEVPGVTDANIQVSERADAAGVVEVKLGLPAVTDELVQQVESVIFAARPAGVRVTHNLPRRGAQAATALLPDRTLAERGNTRELGVDVLNEFPDGLLGFQAMAAIRLVQSDLPLAQQDAIRDAVKQRIVDYFAALPMGSDVVYAKLVARVVAADEVADARVLFGPAGREPPRLQENIATSGRKATIGPAAVDVSLMIEPVTVDILVRVTDGPVASAYQTAASDAIAPLVLGASRSAPILQSDLKAAVDAAWKKPLPGAPAGSHAPTLAGDDAIVVNARYADTGRVLTHTQQVTLAENHAARLGRVTVDVAGPGGGA
jgi:uncharacterized phage protein gp47/JayE